MNQEKINLKQSRDFGETFNASIKLLRQNFKLLFQCLLFIAGPFLLISSIAGAFYQATALTMYSPRMQMNNPMDILSQFGWAYLIFIVTAVIANLALVGTVYCFMLEYQEKGPGNFTAGDVGSRLASNVGNILSVFFSVTFLMILAIALLVGVFIAIGSISPVLAGLLAVLLFFGLLIIFPPLIWQLSVVYLVKMQSDMGPLEAFGKTREAMRDNFWWTWVIVVCSSIGVGLAGLVFAMPQFAYQMVITFSNMRGEGEETSIGFIVVATICTFFSTLLYSVLYIINGVHYYSLAEKKDGQGLMERINEIGNTPPPNVNQQY